MCWNFSHSISKKTLRKKQSRIDNIRGEAWRPFFFFFFFFGGGELFSVLMTSLTPSKKMSKLLTCFEAVTIQTSFCQVSSISNKNNKKRSHCVIFKDKNLSLRTLSMSVLAWYNTITFKSYTFEWDILSGNQRKHYLKEKELKNIDKSRGKVQNTLCSSSSTYSSFGTSPPSPPPRPFTVGNW